MRKTILGFVGSTTLVATLLAMPSAASAETRQEIWKCWTVYGTETIAKTAFYTCPSGTINIWYTDLNGVQMKLSGSCANKLWNDSGRTATYLDAKAKCRIWP
ncbi:hypothetical protein [Micromonospora sp. DPT]|uniref:hypothetical protein n=1 Tax=Micromonospora sp. DPT TaxID=3142975 RepID=UPI00320B110D